MLNLLVLPIGIKLSANTNVIEAQDNSWICVIVKSKLKKLVMQLSKKIGVRFAAKTPIE